jgi:hypothetical protein
MLISRTMGYAAGAALLLGLGVVVGAAAEDDFVRKLHEAMVLANPDYAENKASVKSGEFGVLLTIRYCRIDSLAPFGDIGGGSLRMLNCTSANWAATGLGDLGVRELQVVDCEGLGDFGLVRKMPRLSSLRAQGNVPGLDCLVGSRLVSLTVSSPDLKSIGFVREMLGLRHLQLEDCTGITDFTPLAESLIESLILHRGSSFSDEDTAVLARMPLRTLYLRDTQIRFIDFLEGCPGIETLHLPETVADCRPLFGLTKLSFLEVGKLRLRGEELREWLLANGKDKGEPGPEGALRIVVDDAGGKAPDPKAGGGGPEGGDRPENWGIDMTDDPKTIKAEMGLKFRDVEDGLVIIEHENGAGSGFLAKMDGEVYVVTNQHVIVAGERPTFKTMRGTPLKVVEFEVSEKYDMARFRLEGAVEALEFADRVDIGAPVAVFGNSGGGGVFTELYGRVQGVGPDKIEISAKIVQGNSGSAILDKDRKVVGIATYVTMPSRDDDWVKQGTRFADSRRFGLRIGPDHAWVKTNWKAYRAQAVALRESMRYVDILFQLSIDWFKDPLREFDKANYPHPDASVWISRHMAGLADYRRTIEKGRMIRTRSELNRKTQRIRDALTNDYKQLVLLFRKKATEVKKATARNEQNMNQFMKEQNGIVVHVMEVIATQIEKAGKELVQPDSFDSRDDSY